MSWDNESGKEAQPWATAQYWVALTGAERQAALVLGFTASSWDNGPQPAAMSKAWRQLTTCPDGERGSIPLVTVFDWGILIIK